MEMGRKKVKEKSIVTYKKDDLWDELLTPLEVEEPGIGDSHPDIRLGIRMVGYFDF